MLEVRGWRLGKWRLETGSWRLRLEAGSWSWLLGPESSVVAPLAPGSPWLLSPAPCSWLLMLVLAPGSWPLAPGLWLLAHCSWPLVPGS